MASTNSNPGNDVVPLKRGDVQLTLPTWPRFLGHQFLFVFYSLVLNGLGAALTFWFCSTPSAAEPFRPIARWLLSGPALENNASIALFVAFALASLAAVANAIGPLHSAHDAAVKYFHDIELCKKLSSEIVNANYAQDKPIKKAWAVNTNKSCPQKRKNGKRSLFFATMFMIATIIGPWLWIIHELHWSRFEIIIVIVLLAPLIFWHTVEVLEMIWPGKNAFLLGEGELAAPNGNHGK